MTFQTRPLLAQMVAQRLDKLELGPDFSLHLPSAPCPTCHRPYRDAVLPKSTTLITSGSYQTPLLMAAGPKGWTSILAWQPGPFKLISNVRANHDRIRAHQRYASCPQTTCTRCLSPLCLELRRNLDSICQGHFLLVCHALLALRPSSRACSIPSHIPHFACLPRYLVCALSGLC